MTTQEKMTGVASVLSLTEFTDMISGLFGVRNPKTGQPVTFSLYPGQHTFNYYRDDAGNLQCYTPHKDDDGNYWCWTYVTRKDGIRKMTGLVRCAKRKTARTKAANRYYKAQAKARARKEAKAARKAARQRA